MSHASENGVVHVFLFLACAEVDGGAFEATDKRRPRTGAASWPASKRAVQVGDGLPTTYEASGAFWHRGRGTLFVVSDGGLLDELAEDGTGVGAWTPGGDLEAVTAADVRSSLVYVGVERPDSIVEVDLARGAATGRAWDLTATMRTADDNLGLEGLAFVPDGDHPYADSSSGGLFYAGLQETGAIYVFDADLGASGVVTWVDTIATGRADLSDLAYDPDTGRLYALFDTDDVLRELSTAGRTLAEYEVPGTDQEGVTLRAGCPGGQTTIFIAEDGGPSVKAYARYPIDCP